MKKNPLVSIILPTYNRSSLLPHAINSVISQKYEAWELIVVDDGSTDDTMKLLQEYSTRDTRMRIFTHDNIGPSKSRNLGLVNAWGEYSTFLDSDDEYLPDHLRFRVDFLNAHPEIELLHGGIIISGDAESQYVPDARNPAKKIALTECIVGGTFFGKTEIFLDSGGWPEGFGEDFLFFQRLSLRYRIDKVDFPTYLYHRESPDSRCSNFIGNT